MTKLFDEGVYRVVDNDKLNMTGIEITQAPYEGVIFVYGKVQFVEGKNHLNFQRNIVKVPEDADIDELNKDANLQQLMGDILVELIQHQVEKEDADRTSADNMDS